MTPFYRWGHRLSRQASCPGSMWLSFETVGGTQNSGKSSQELGCRRDGGILGLRPLRPLVILLHLQESEILRDPGAPLTSQQPPWLPRETCLTASLSDQPVSGAATSHPAALPREPQWMGVGLREPQELQEALSAFCCGRVGKGQLVVGAQGWVEASSFLLPCPPTMGLTPPWLGSGM